MALSLLAGDRLGDLGNGLLVLGLAGARRLRADRPQRSADDQRGGARGLVRAARQQAVPARPDHPGRPRCSARLLYNYTPLGGTGLFEAKRETYILLGLGVLLALGAIFAWLRPPPLAPLQEGRRLIDAIGWAAVLPQMLAALGVRVRRRRRRRRRSATLTRTVIPEGSVFLTVAVFGLGMALFTMIMGNAFAAFPVMAAAIGVPLLIQHYGGDPAVVGAIGMLAGFCGTLMTPMAANFNLVPAALLELKDQNGVIKAQIATALPLLASTSCSSTSWPSDEASTPDLADRFARIALGHVTREYPHKLDHVLDGAEDALPPRALHPIFFGSFDWHSCVHG